MEEKLLNKEESQLLKVLLRKSRLQLDAQETELEIARLKEQLPKASVDKVQNIFTQRVLKIMKEGTGKEPHIKRKGKDWEIIY